MIELGELLKIVADVIRHIPTKRSQELRKVIEKYYEKEEEIPMETHSAYTGETKTYEGQSDVAYCAECLVSHYIKMLGYLDEAKRLSLNDEVLNDESMRRVDEAFREMVTSLYDLGAVDNEDTLWFRREIRRIRKEIFVPLIATRDKNLLEKAIQSARMLYERAKEMLRKAGVPSIVLEKKTE